MKADLVEQLDVCKIQPRAAFLPLPGQVCELLSRFPAVSHGMLSLVDQVIVSATSFATMVIIGRGTSPQELGLYYLVITIVFISVGVQEQIVAAPYTIYSKRYRDDELLTYAGSVWFHQIVLIGVGLAALLAAIAATAASGSARMLPVLWALAAAGPFLLLREWVRRFAYANLKVLPAVALDAIVAVVQLGGLLLLWRLDVLPVYAIFLVMGAACACGCLSWYTLDRPTVHVDRRRFWPDWTYNWSFARWALRGYLASNTTPFIMPWILGLAVGTAAAGVFGACNTLINISNVFLLSVDRVVMPRAAQAYARGGCSELRRVLGWASLVVLPVLGAFCLGIFVIGSQLAVFVYGHQYAGHGPILTALAATMFMNGVGAIAGNGLWAVDQPRSNFVADVVTLLVTVVTGFLLVVPLGALGAALAILAGTTTGCAVRTVRLLRALASLETSSDFAESGEIA